MLISAVREDLCLVYANTLSWRGSATPVEELRDFAALLGWIERSARVGAGGAREIKNWARRHRREAATVFAEAIALREVIFRIFAAFAVSEPVRDRDFLALKSALAAAPARSELARLHGGYAWRIEHPRPSVSDLLIAVLWSAADLMLDARKRRIRQCASEKCLWLFIDESKSGTRRWCDMASCGNRAKSRRHYLKTKS